MKLLFLLLVSQFELTQVDYSMFILTNLTFQSNMYIYNEGLANNG